MACCCMTAGCVMWCRHTLMNACVGVYTYKACKNGSVHLSFSTMLLLIPAILQLKSRGHIFLTPVHIAAYCVCAHRIIPISFATTTATTATTTAATTTAATTATTATNRHDCGRSLRQLLYLISATDS